VDPFSQQIGVRAEGRSALICGWMCYKRLGENGWYLVKTWIKLRY